MKAAGSLRQRACQQGTPMHTPRTRVTAAPSAPSPKLTELSPDELFAAQTVSKVLLCLSFTGLSWEAWNLGRLVLFSLFHRWRD